MAAEAPKTKAAHVDAAPARWVEAERAGPVPLKGEKTAKIADGRKKVRSEFVDGSEMVEEYDVITDELLVRKVRRPNVLGGEGEWVFEVGGDVYNATAFVPDRDLLRESASQPQLSRKDTADAFEFRIRNLPYPKDVFSVQIEPATPDAITVRTSNKKYFKRLEIPEMKRQGLALDGAALSWDHARNTLLVAYKKPMALRVVEAAERRERATLKADRPETGDKGCAQQ